MCIFNLLSVKTNRQMHIREKRTVDHSQLSPVASVSLPALICRIQQWSPYRNVPYKALASEQASSMAGESPAMDYSLR